MAKLYFIPGLGAFRSGDASATTLLPSSGAFTNEGGAPPPPDDAEVSLPTGSLVVNAHNPSVEATETEVVTRTPLLHIPTNPREELAIDETDPLRPSYTLYLYGHTALPVPSLENANVYWQGQPDIGVTNGPLWSTDPQGEGPELYFLNDVSRSSQITGANITGRPWTLLGICRQPGAAPGTEFIGAWSAGRESPTDDYVAFWQKGHETNDPYKAYAEVEADGAGRGEVNPLLTLDHSQNDYTFLAWSATGATDIKAYGAQHIENSFTQLGELSTFVGGPVTDFPLEWIFPGQGRVDATTPRWFDSYFIGFLIWDSKALTEAELNELLNDQDGFFRHVVLGTGDDSTVNLPTDSLTIGSYPPQVETVAPTGDDEIDVPTASVSINAYAPQIDTLSDVPIRTPILGVPLDPREDLEIDLTDPLRPSHTFYMEGGPTSFPLPAFENPEAILISGAGTDTDGPVWSANPNGEGDEMFFQQGPPYRSLRLNLTPIPYRPWTIVVISRFPSGSTFNSHRAPFGIGNSFDWISTRKEGVSDQYLPYGYQGSQGDDDSFWYDTGGPVHDDTKYTFHVLSALDGTNVHCFIGNSGDANLANVGEMSAAIGFSSPITDFALEKIWLGGDELNLSKPSARWSNGYIVALNFWENKALTYAEADELYQDGFFRHFQKIQSGTTSRTPKLRIPTTNRSNLKLLLLPDRPDYTFYFEGGLTSLPVASFEDPAYTLEAGADAILTGPDWETGGPEGPELHFSIVTPQAAHVVAPIPPADVQVPRTQLQVSSHNPTIDAAQPVGPSECPGIIAPGYAPYPGVTRVRFDNGEYVVDDLASTFRYAVGRQYVSVMKLRVRWDDVEGDTANDYAGLHALLDAAVPFAESNGWHISLEVEGQRFGSTLPFTNGAKTPAYLNDTSIYPGDDRSAANTGYNIYGGHYFTGTSTSGNGKWFERSWDENQKPYADRKAKVHAEGFNYLKTGFGSDKSGLLAYVCATSETAKPEFGRQSEYSDAKFVAQLQYMAEAYRRELNAVGGNAVTVMFLLNFWPANWAMDDWEGKVINPILSSATNVGFGMRDSVVTVLSGGCNSGDIETHSKQGLWDHCMRNHSTVPWMMTAENASYTFCNSLTNNPQTLAELTNTFNGTYSNDPGYQGEAGFWPKASLGRNGAHPHWFEVYIARSEANQQMTDAAGNTPMDQQIECKKYYP